MEKDLDAKILPKLLRYDPLTGLLYWLPRDQSMFKGTRSWAAKAWNSQWAGKQAFTAVKEEDNRYYIGAIFGDLYRASRVIWALHHGKWPEHHLDHINGDTLDNRLENLRDVPNMVNHRNETMSKNNTSGFNGVYWDKQTGKWRAMIKVNFRTIQLGRFVNFDDAVAARKAANVTYGFTERHGLPL